MRRENIKALVLSLLTLVFILSCEKEENKYILPPNTEGQRKVFVVCEGSLGNGNGSLSMYLPSKDSLYEDVYKTINGQPLGDVFHSITRIGERYYLAINNSDKVIVLNADLTLHTTVNVLKPRYILPVNDEKAYVSSLFNNKLYVLNTSTNGLQGTIDLHAKNAEGMLLHEGKAYICTWDTAVNEIYVVSTTTDQVIDSHVIAGFAPQEILLDKEDKLWVLSGNVPKGKSAAWTRIDPVTGQVLKSYSFPATADPIHPVFNKTKDTLYFIEVNYSGGTEHNGVYRMAITDVALPQQPFIAAQALQYFWALGVDPATGDVYIGDPKGFIQKGSVMVCRPDGSLRKQFNVGVGPGHFYFAD
jgi:hypothetical protein